MYRKYCFKASLGIYVYNMNLSLDFNSTNEQNWETRKLVVRMRRVERSSFYCGPKESYMKILRRIKATWP